MRPSSFDTTKIRAKQERRKKALKYADWMRGRDVARVGSITLTPAWGIAWTGSPGLNQDDGQMRRLAAILGRGRSGKA